MRRSIAAARADFERQAVKLEAAATTMLLRALGVGQSRDAVPARDGNHHLNMAFYRAAIRAVQCVPEVKAEFQRWHRRKGKPMARALIAKELATIVYAMLSKSEPFNRTLQGRPVVTTTRCTWPRLENPLT